MATFSSHLVAACGMNCAICMAHLRERKPCPGCRTTDDDKPVTRVRCKIKTCSKLGKGGNGFCYGCDEFPCENLTRLDTRYSTKYHMSMIANLCRIKGLGMEEFLRYEAARWTCSACGGTLCLHEGKCVECGREGS